MIGKGCGALPPRRVKERFRELIARWHEDTLHVSSTDEMIRHPAYQEIIAMGWSAVPLLLTEMRERPNHWAPALQTITGAQPVPKEAYGRLDQIAEAWLDWAEENGVEYDG